MVNIIGQCLKSVAAVQEQTINEVCHSNANGIAQTVAELEKIHGLVEEVKAAILSSNEAVQVWRHMLSAAQHPGAACWSHACSNNNGVLWLACLRSCAGPESSEPVLGVVLHAVACSCTDCPSVGSEESSSLQASCSLHVSGCRWHPGQQHS